MKEKIIIIAEAGVNHNGSVALAKQLIEIAANAGADVVKFQTFNTDDILTKSTPKAEYQITEENSDSQYDMIKALELSENEFLELSEHCKKNNILFLSTPFDFRSLKFLIEKIQMPQIKIASNEITNGPLLLAAARTGKPIILSTGMCNLQDIEEALSIIAFGYMQPSQKACEENFRRAYHSKMGKDSLIEKVCLLHCTSAYPAKHEDVNLKAMKTLSTAFGLHVGYSDHTLGIEVPIAAAALGAKIIEKHFTIDKTFKGPDHQMSLSPDELYEMVRAIRNVEKALGDGVKKPKECEYEMLKVMRRSLIANDILKTGDIFTEENLAAKQPGYGVSPMRYWEYIGEKANKNYEKDEIIC